MRPGWETSQLECKETQRPAAQLALFVQEEISRIYSGILSSKRLLLMSAAYRNLILFPLVFLIGVWVGQNSLIDQQSEGQGKSGRTEFRSELEQRTSEKLTRGTVKDQQAGDVSLQQQLTSIASDLDPSWENSESEPIKELSDMLAQSNENPSESYSSLIDAAQKNTAIEPSPQSLEDDIIRSLEEAGIPPEEITNNVENLMGMILHEDQQTSETYPNIYAP